MSAVAERRRLSADDQLRRELLIGLYLLRFRRTLRGRRWVRCFLVRRGWR